MTITASVILPLLLAACAGEMAEREPPAVDAAALEATLPRVERDAALRAAAESHARGDLERAQRRYMAVLEQDPEDPEARIGLGEVYLAAGNAQRAQGLFAALPDGYADSPRALQGRGLALGMLGRHEEARPYLERAVAADGRLWRAWNALGSARDVEGDWEGAEAAYARALELKPDSAAVYNNRGVSRLMQGRYAEAGEDFQAALDAQPNFEAARENLRIALAWRGRYIEAMAGARREEMPRILNNIGYIAMLRGDYDTAEGYFVQAMELSPSYYEKASRNLDELRYRKTYAEVAR